MRRLRHHSKGEASADDSCCNQFPGFHVIFSLTPFRLDSLNLYSADGFLAVSAIKEDSDTSAGGNRGSFSRAVTGGSIFR
jgi:hypothetical protein